MSPWVGLQKSFRSIPHQRVGDWTKSNFPTSVSHIWSRMDGVWHKRTGQTEFSERLEQWPTHIKRVTRLSATILTRLSEIKHIHLVHWIANEIWRAAWHREPIWSECGAKRKMKFPTNIQLQLLVSGFIDSQLANEVIFFNEGSWSHSTEPKSMLTIAW